MAAVRSWAGCSSTTTTRPPKAQASPVCSSHIKDRGSPNEARWIYRPSEKRSVGVFELLFSRELQRASSKTVVRQHYGIGRTGYTFFNVGEDKAGHRCWEDCQKYGFLQAGGGPRFRDKLAALNRGDRVLAYLKSHGYVGLGTVTGQATLLRDFVVASEGKRLLDLAIASTIDDGRLDDDERGEFCVGIEWTKAVPREAAVCGHFSKRGTSCRMLHQAEVDAIITALEQVASS